MKADPVAAPDAIELPRDRRGDELMMEVEAVREALQESVPIGRNGIMKFLLLTYDPQGTDGPDVVPFDDEASAFAELKRATHAKQPREKSSVPHGLD